VGALPPHFGAREYIPRFFPIILLIDLEIYQKRAGQFPAPLEKGLLNS
jgi:hypothetical protein